MISTHLTHPSRPKTLGELRQLTAHLPDATPLMNEDGLAYGETSPEPAIWLSVEDESPVLVFSEPL